MTKRNLVKLALAVILAGGAPAAQKPASPEAALGQAIHIEEAKGDFQGAINAYKQFLARYPGSNALAAKAQFRLGQCYEKLGNSEARKAYEQLIRRYPEQSEWVSQARFRLSAMTVPPKANVVARQLWAGADADAGAVPSPDGRWLAASDRDTGNLVLRDVATGQVRRLTNKGPWSESGDSAEMPVFSRDGQRIVYTWWIKDRQSGWLSELRVIGVDGSNPRTLLKASDLLSYAYDWSPDGNRILITHWWNPGKFAMAWVNVSDGSVKELKSQRATGRISPDGRWIVYAQRSRNQTGGSDICLLSTDGSRDFPLVESPADNRSPAWTPDGKRIVFASDRSGTQDLWALTVADGQAQGAPELLRTGGGSGGQFTNDGSYFYGFVSASADIYLADLDPATGKMTGEPARLTSRYRNHSPLWSPDGQRLAYVSRCGTIRSLQDTPTLVIRNFSTGEEKEFSGKIRWSCVDNPIQWFPDGKAVLGRNLRTKSRLINAESGADQEASADFGEDLRQAPWALSRDGGTLFHARNRIIRRDLATGREQDVVKLADGASAVSLSLSYDGGRLAFMIGGQSEPGLFTVPATGGEPKRVFRNRPDLQVEGRSGTGWSPDGRFIYFSASPSEGRKPANLYRVPVEGGEAEQVLALPGLSIGWPAVQPDGKKIAFSAFQSKNEVWMLQGLLSPAARAR